MQYRCWHDQSQCRLNGVHYRLFRYVRQSLAMAAWVLTSGVAFAQDSAVAPAVGMAALPRDLSPWGMFVNADVVGKAVIVGLAGASLVTWTVWFAQSIEIKPAKAHARA